MKTIITTLAVLLGFTAVQSQSDSLWLRYSAISPDGKSIVFARNGDLYLVNVSGGVATPLVIHSGYDFEPVWSPDGKTIVFASDRNGNFDVYSIASSGGNASRLTFHSSSDIPTGFTPDGKNVLFTSNRHDDVKSQLFPVGGIPELYQVPLSGGREQLVLTTPALHATWSKDGSKLLYEDVKGYEDYWRKHHTSSVTRDIWIYDKAKDSHTQVSDFKGEDLYPVFHPNQNEIYYLSEQFGAFNVVKKNLQNNTIEQISRFENHPVRQLSISDDGLLCYSWHGVLYTQRPGDTPKRVEITFVQDGLDKIARLEKVGSPSEFEVSPNGKEIAFIYRGEVFVASMAEGTVKRITNTPEQERNVSFSPDGRKLLYASERGNSWKIYTSEITRKEEPYFFISTILKEELIVDTGKETFQPRFSPDGKEIAFLEERTALKVINLATKAIREIMPEHKNYSYADGDQHYQWSPDGKWFLVNYLPGAQWISQIGLISADGKGEVKNLSQSGYGAESPQWMMQGKMLLWFSARDGMKNHASWGGQSDVYASFFTQEAFDEFIMNEEEFNLYKEIKEKQKQEEAKVAEGDKKKSKDKKEDKKAEGEISPLKIELEGLQSRKLRLTLHSSNLVDAYVTSDGSKLFYIAQVEKGFDLWQTNLRTKETKVVTKLGDFPGGMVADTVGKQLLVFANGGIMKVNMESGEIKPLPLQGEMQLDERAERLYLAEHIWRQVQKKFYTPDLHGVKWDFYKSEYFKKVKHLNNNYDFAELMGEMLGELNASHTGAFYNNWNPDGDQTAGLGLLYDNTYLGDGLRIAEVMPKNTVFKNGSKVENGVVIEKIDGEKIEAGRNYYPLLNRKAGKLMLLSLWNPKTNVRWEETVKPVGMGQEMGWMYERWVNRCERIVDSLSNGQLGYVHVRGMDDRSYRKVYEDALGKHAFKKGLVVDTRFNGGGWLHDDLATFLAGTPYLNIAPRGQDLGTEPMFKWSKKSVVVMNESNYSDAHLFPFTYKTLGVGDLVGMPVPGTGTAVWWEGLQNGVVFGIPQVGMVNKNGQVLENLQLEPDYIVPNRYETVAKGRDEQLEKAVEVLMK